MSSNWIGPEGAVGTGSCDLIAVQNFRIDCEADHVSSSYPPQRTWMPGMYLGAQPEAHASGCTCSE